MIATVEASPYSKPRGRLTALLLLLFLVVPLYAHVGDAVWQLDDRANIVDNRYLHIHDLTPASLGGTFFANQGRGGRLFRPVANLTFALNWLGGEDDPRGYRWCNVGLHILTAYALYLFILKLGRTPGLRREFPPGGLRFAALLTAALWAVHPIQIQAVTYVVQRMSILAALFYLLSMHAYLSARMSAARRARWIWLGAGLLFFLLALGSKENAIMLPAVLVLLELVSFQTPERLRQQKPQILPVALGGLLLVGLGAFAFLDFNPVGYLIQAYSERPFTLTERLLTQTRIVVFYISQIVMPTPDRLSIVHDVTLSRTLLQPWTTLPAILFLILLGTVGVRLIWRRRLIALAILFFLLNHVVESSILPLELVFEHRNYLPSFFVFLPVAAGLGSLLEKFRNASRPLFYLLTGLTVFWIVSLGLGTYIRNTDWLTEERLWTDAMTKAPGNARPLNNLAIRLAWSENPTPENYARAYAMFSKALDLDITHISRKAETIGNMASVLYHNGNYEKAVELYRQALQVDPRFIKGRADLIMPLALAGRWEEARLEADILVTEAPFNPNYWNLSGFIYLWQGDASRALIDFRKALALAPRHVGIWHNIGVALNRLGSLPNGQWFLQQAARSSPGDLQPRLALIENAFLAGDDQRVRNECRQLLKSFPLTVIYAHLERLPRERRKAPVDHEKIVPVVLTEITGFVTGNAER